MFISDRAGIFLSDSVSTVQTQLPKSKITCAIIRIDSKKVEQLKEATRFLAEQQEKAEKHLRITSDIWKDADEDYIFSNMAKATAQEWGIENIP